MRALQLKPDYLEAFLALAYLSAQVGLAQRAEDALLQAQNLTPHNPRIAALRHEIQNYFKQVLLHPSPISIWNPCYPIACSSLFSLSRPNGLQKN